MHTVRLARTMSALRSVLFVLAAASFLASPASAQPKPRPKAAPKAVSPAAAAASQLAAFKQAHGKLRKQVSAIARQGTIKEGDKPTVEQYYSMFAEKFTLPAAEVELPSERDSLKREIRVWGNAPDKAGLKFVNTVLLTSMQEVAFDQEKKFNIAARINAMLVISDLNEVETSVFGTGPSTPMAEAAKVLHQAVVEPDMADAVKVAAMIGLLRHAQSGMTDKQLEKQVHADMLKLVKENEVPITFKGSEESHEWVRRRAMEIVAAIKKPGDEETADAFKAILVDEENSLAFRCDAAVALGKVGANDPELVGTLANLSLEIAQGQTTRRGLKRYLQCVQHGLNGVDGKEGIAKGLPPTQKKFADELSQKLTSFTETVDMVSTDALLPEIINAEADKFEQWLKSSNAQASTTPPQAAAN